MSSADRTSVAAGQDERVVTLKIEWEGDVVSRAASRQPAELHLLAEDVRGEIVKREVDDLRNQADDLAASVELSGIGETPLTRQRQRLLDALRRAVRGERGLNVENDLLTFVAAGLPPLSVLFGDLPYLDREGRADVLRDGLRGAGRREAPQ